MHGRRRKIDGAVGICFLQKQRATNLAPMKSKLVALALALLVLLPGALQAKTIKFPKKHPEFSITFPNDWKAEITDAGIISAQPKGAAYAISIFPVQATTMRSEERR